MLFGEFVIYTTIYMCALAGGKAFVTLARTGLDGIGKRTSTTTTAATSKQRHSGTHNPRNSGSNHRDAFKRNMYHHGRKVNTIASIGDPFDKGDYQHP
jgi:hypothetical protein